MAKTDYDDLYPDDCGAQVFPDGIGTILHELLNPTPRPGPPRVHDLTPRPDGYDEDGNAIWPRHPAYTITRMSDD